MMLRNLDIRRLRLQTLGLLEAGTVQIVVSKIRVTIRPFLERTVLLFCYLSFLKDAVLFVLIVLFFAFCPFCSHKLILVLLRFTCRLYTRMAIMMI